MTSEEAQQRAERVVNEWRAEHAYLRTFHQGSLEARITAELLAVQREAREACAELCDSLGADDEKPTDRVIGYEECADAIRGESHE